MTQEDFDNLKKDFEELKRNYYKDRFSNLQIKNDEFIFNNDVTIKKKIGFFGKAPIGQRLAANYYGWSDYSKVVQALVDLGLFDHT
jgi:hypothetical protein